LCIFDGISLIRLIDEYSFVIGGISEWWLFIGCDEYGVVIGVE
jgi:hypothetical protein